MKRTLDRIAFVALFLGLAGSVRAEGEKVLFEKRTHTDAQGKTLPYRLLKPENYDPKAKYPLVLFLHGRGECGDDNEKQVSNGVLQFATADNRKKHPCFLAVPQCPQKGSWTGEPQRLCLEMLGALQKEFSIDPSRLYVTGLSMGGFGTWDILVRHPEMFAAGVPICGGGDENQAAKIAKVPIWVFHGAQDPTVKPELSRKMVEALKKAGGNPKYTEYPDVKHNSWVPAYKDPELFRWLFEQKRP